MNELDHELNIISELYKDDKHLNIFDAGGFTFDHSLVFKENFPLANVYSFEPDLSNIQNYSKQATDKGIKIIPSALSDTNGVSDFFASSFIENNDGTTREWKGSGSILKPVLIEGTNREKCHPFLEYEPNSSKTRTIRLDTFCELKNIKKIDFFHLDVQGAEHIVLKGLGSKLRPKYIFSETCEYESYETNGMNKEKFNKFMANLGYSIIHEFRDDTLYKYEN